MNKKHQHTITLILLILPTLLSLLPEHATTESTTRAAGVKAGDMVRYGDFKALWGSTIPGATAPQNLIDINNTSSVVNTVLSVSGTIISFESRTHYINGTETVENKEVDVTSGNGSGNLTFVAAGLGTTDKVYLESNVTDAHINSTALRSYCGLMRETNLFNTTQVFPARSIAFWVEYFWDKATGMLTEQFWSYTQLTEDNLLDQGSLEYKMIDNNIWIGTPDSTPPTANAGPDQTIEIDTPAILDASASRDNVGIAKILWEFGDGTSATSLKATHNYDRIGAYNVTLTVEDGSGNKAFDYVTITVKQKTYTFPTTEVIIVAGVVVLAILLAAWSLSKRRHPKRKRR